MLLKPFSLIKLLLLSVFTYYAITASKTLNLCSLIILSERNYHRIPPLNTQQNNYRSFKCMLPHNLRRNAKLLYTNILNFSRVTISYCLENRTNLTKSFGVSERTMRITKFKLNGSIKK